MTGFQTTLSAQTSCPPPIKLALEKHRTRVSLPLELIRGARPSSHPGSEPWSFHIRRVHVAIALLSLEFLRQICSGVFFSDSQPLPAALMSVKLECKVNRET